MVRLTKDKFFCVRCCVWHRDGITRERVYLNHLEYVKGDTKEIEK